MTANERQTDIEEAIGGYRNARAGKLAEDKELSARESQRGERGKEPGPSVEGKT